MVPGSGGWQGKGPVARSTGSVAPSPFQRAVEEGWNKSGATRSGNVSDDTATITVRPMTASQSQKSKGGFFGSFIKKGTPEQASGSRSQAAKVAVAAFGKLVSPFGRHRPAKPKRLSAGPLLASGPIHA